MTIIFKTFAADVTHDSRIGRCSGGSGRNGRIRRIGCSCSGSGSDSGSGSGRGSGSCSCSYGSVRHITNKNYDNFRSDNSGIFLWANSRTIGK